MSGPVVLIANRKGGTGKTTLSVNLAAELGRQVGRTLVVDLDPQGHAGLGLGVTAKPGDLTIHALFAGELNDPLAAIRTSRAEAVDVLPANRSFVGEFAIRDPRLLDEALGPLRQTYAAIILDTPPNVDPLLVNALAAANLCLVPTMLHWLALEGVGQFVRAFFQIVSRFNRHDPQMAIVPVQVDARSKMQRAVLAELLRRYGTERIFRAIRIDACLADAFGSGVPLRLHRPQSRGVSDFESLTQEILAHWSNEFSISSCNSVGNSVMEPLYETGASGR